VDEGKVRHRFAEAAGLAWHDAEMGKDEPVVFLNSVPESWYCRSK